MTENSFYLQAIVNGDSKTIKTIYTIVLPKVIRFVFQNKGQEEDARDVFQKALLQLSLRYQKEKFEITSSFEAYLFTVCKNLWRRELNKSKREVTTDNVIELKDDNEDIIYSVLEQKRWELFQENLEKMSINCKSILKLFLKKTPYVEIMKQFNYNSETVVRQRVFKCKNKLIALVKSDKRFNELIVL